MLKAVNKRRTPWFRRILQVRLATIMAAVLVASLAMGLYRFVNQRYYAQQAALKAVGEKITFLQTEPGSPTFLGYVVKEEAFKDVTRVSFHGRNDVTDKDMPHLRHFPRLKRLSLHRAKVTDKGVKYLAELYELEALSLAYTKVSDQGLEHLKDLTSLRELHIDTDLVQGEGIRHLAGLKNLEILDLKCKTLKDKDLAVLLNMPRLRELIIRSPGLKKPAPYLATLKHLRKVHINSPDLLAFELSDMPRLEQLGIVKYKNRSKELAIRLRDMPRLESINISTQYQHCTLVEYINLPKLKIAYIPRAKHIVMAGLPAIKKLRSSSNLRPATFVLKDLPNITSLNLYNAVLPAHGWKHVGELKSLEYLSLRGLGVNDAMLPALAGLHKLEKLYLSNSQIQGYGFAALQDLKQLKALSLNSSPLRDEHMHHIGGLTSLEELTMYGAPLTDRGVAKLGGLTNLKMLSLQRTRIEGLGLAVLKNCDKLQHLVISNTAISDEGLTFLPPLPALRTLQAGYLNITDASIDTLIEWKQLSWLGLYKCKISAGGAKLLRAAMAGTRIQISPVLPVSL